MKTICLGGLWAVLACCSCNHFGDQAATYAKTETAAMDAVRPAATLAYHMCHVGAAYYYFDDLLKKERKRLDDVQRAQTDVKPAVVPPKLWPAWYCTEPASHGTRVPGVATLPRAAWCTANVDAAIPRPAPAGTVPWVDFCDDLGTTGRVLNGAVLSLRKYAVVMDGVAEGKPVDASGIQSLSGGVNTTLTALQASTKVTGVAKGIGGILSALYPALLQAFDQRELRSLVGKANPVVHDLTGKLMDLTSALVEELELFSDERNKVLKDAQAIRQRAGGEQLAITDMLNEYELAADRGDDFLRIKARLEAYRGLLQATQRAHDALSSGDENNSARELAAFSEQTAQLEVSTLPAVTLLPPAVDAPKATPAAPPGPQH